MAIVLVGVVGFMLLSKAPLVGAVIIAVAAAAFLGVVVVSSALNQIFRVAVYQYAANGAAPSGFDGRELEAAFDRTQRRRNTQAGTQCVTVLRLDP